jgi:cardiolipin synthase A/B
VAQLSHRHRASPRSPPLAENDAVNAFVFKSSPADRSTVSRVLFHSLIACARESTRICTPYFVPDRGMREALIHAARRGVKVEVLVPGGEHADQPLLRVASRHWFGELLGGGVRVHEYLASMLHQKLLLVDDWWVVAGTTNLDNRSFEHNDEVNVAFPDAGLARQITELYERDLRQSARVTLDEWRQRSLAERAVSHVAWVLDRQQ